MDRTKEPPLLAPSLLIRRVTRDADGTTAAGNVLAIETVRYSLRECPWVPDLEVFEQEGQFVIQVDLPAIELEEVSVSVTDDRVRIQGTLVGLIRRY